MIIEDRFTIGAPVEDTWHFLLDIPRVSQCIPGAQDIEQVDDETYKGALVVKVGPIGANFSGQVQLVDLDPPHSMKATARGKDRATSSMASIDFSAALAPLDGGETEVTFHVDVSIRGRLGQFGQGVMRETARQLTQVFAECVQARLAQQSAGKHDSPKTAGDAIDDSSANDDSTNTYPAPATAVSQNGPQAPSLVAILVKSIVNTFRNWLRSLRTS